MMEIPMESLIRKYDRPVPRYTSFPTAVQFTESPTWSEHRSLITELNRSEPASIYIHVPFCHSLCHYCGCHTKIVSRYEPVKEYISSLLEEISIFRSTLCDRIPASRIHFGGGSPNFTEIEDLRKILESLRETFSFSHETEIDMECDPRLLTEEKINALSKLDINRISLGVQDFDKNVQEAINRVQPYELVEKCVSQLRERGISHVNFDLMTGLPLQTLETLERTLDLTLSLCPDRIAIFSYAHVPWMKKHQLLLEKYPRPDLLTRFEMAERASSYLQKNDYIAIGFDHFALKNDSLAIAQETGKLHRNFQGYTDDGAKTLIGFGLSAISQYENAYTQNTTDPTAYRQALKERRLPSARSCHLKEEDKIRRSLIERIMCDFRVNLSDFPQIPVPCENLSPLLSDGLASFDDTRKVLLVTERGRPFVRLVAACFDPYLEQVENRHARAI